MSAIPTCEFSGPLKQMSIDGLPVPARALFQIIFPRFYDTTDFSWDDHPKARDAFQSIEGIVFTEERVPRRYGGVRLPRGRYLSVCITPDGNDHNALVNELGAYRNPVQSGRVDLIDFGVSDVTLEVNGREMRFGRSSEIGVIIYQPERFASILSEIDHLSLDLGGEKAAALIRYTYRVADVHYPQTVDLRDPAVRAWFVEEFSKPNESWDWSFGGQLTGGAFPEIEHFPSRFESLPGRAPVPRSFREMLPTLINPIRGGGSGNSGGLTLMGIGESLRDRGVDALVYPSARSDAFVIYENGVRRSFGGWCVVNLAHDDQSRATSHVVFDPSPWSWTGLVDGVKVHEFADDPVGAGSLGIDGVEEAARQNYVHQVRSLRTCEEIFGPLCAAMSPREAWAMGIFVFRWLTQALIGTQMETCESTFRSACGLILRNRREFEADELKWTYDQLAAGGSWGDAVSRAAMVVSKIEATIPEGSEVRLIFGAAADLELLLLILTRRTMAGERSIPAGMKTDNLRALPLSAALRQRADTVIAMLENPDSDPSACSEQVATLAEALADTYAERKHEGTPYAIRYTASLVGARRSKA